MQKRNKDILFHIESEAQFDSIKALLIHIRNKTRITFDIVVPSAVSEDTIINKDIYEGGAKVLRENGFKVIRGIDGVVLPETVVKTSYKVLLSAYMYEWHYHNLNAKYHIMFPYASYYFNKPNWTIGRFIEQDYLADALLSHAVGTKEVTDIFAKTYIVPSLKLMDFRKKTQQKKKPVLFFAPTYNEIEFASKFLENIDVVKQKYTVIMRSHHRVSRLKNSKDISEKLYQKADKIFDVGEYPIVTPLEEADVVVSDNSAAIFDAIYCGVTVALFCQDPNSFHYKDVNTAQSELVKKGYVLWTRDPGQILQVVNETLTPKMIKKQQKMRQRLFPNKSTNPVGEWMRVISYYLKDELPPEYSPAKRYWIESINLQTENNQTLNAQIEDLNKRIKSSEDVIYNERNPGVKTAARRLAKACLYKLNILKRGA